MKYYCMTDSTFINLEAIVKLEFKALPYRIEAFYITGDKDFFYFDNLDQLKLERTKIFKAIEGVKD